MQTFIPFELVIIINLKPPRSPFFPCFIESPCIRERDQSLSWDKTTGIFNILDVCSVYTAFEKRLSLNTGQRLLFLVVQVGITDCV